MSGYSSRPLVDKLGLRAGMRCAALAAPIPYAALVPTLPADLVWVEPSAGRLDFIHLFAHQLSELHALLPGCRAAINPAGMIWASWPKRSSGVFTDLDENIIRQFGLSLGLVDVKVCAVNDIWSALKFVIRLVDRT